MAIGFLYDNLKVPPKVLRRANAIKEADRRITGRSTTLIDIVRIGIKQLEDEHRRLRSSLLDTPNGHGRRATDQTVKSKRKRHGPR